MKYLLTDQDHSNTAYLWQDVSEAGGEQDTTTKAEKDRVDGLSQTRAARQDRHQLPRQDAQDEGDGSEQDQGNDLGIHGIHVGDDENEKCNL